MALAMEIGDAYGKNKIDPFSHKLLHGILGAAEGFVLNNIDGAIAGGCSAILAEIVAEQLAPNKPSLKKMAELAKARGSEFTKEEFDSIWNKQNQDYLATAKTVSDIAKLSAVSAALLSSQDVFTANFTASNAIDNNFFVLIFYGLMAADLAYTAYDIYQTYHDAENGGTEAALIKLGVESLKFGTTLVGGRLVQKVTGIVGGKLIEGSEKLIKAALDRNPAFKVALGKVANELAKGLDKIAETSAGKIAIKTIEVGNKIDGKILQKEAAVVNGTKRLLNKAGRSIRSKLPYLKSTTKGFSVIDPKSPSLGASSAVPGLKPLNGEHSKIPNLGKTELSIAPSLNRENYKAAIDTTAEKQAAFQNLNTAEEVVENTAKISSAVIPSNSANFANKTMEDLIQEAIPRSYKTKGPSKIFDKFGCFNKARQDFESLELINVRDISKPGDLKLLGFFKNGVKVIVRNTSSDNNLPTLEFQIGKKYFKIRYNVK